MLEMVTSSKQIQRLPLSEVPVEFIDALLYNGDMTRHELMLLDELADWSFEQLNVAIELAKKAEAVMERQDGLIVLHDDTARRRIACYG
ncbi:MAG TPA: hypothetical protein V6D29_18750 [Leptolyngbyaceae cyanobacterium]